MTLENRTSWLSETELEEILMRETSLGSFWSGAAPLLLVRSRPSAADPLYEIQLAWDLSDRVETFAWLWVDARSGEIVRRFPES